MKLTLERHLVMRKDKEKKLSLILVEIRAMRVNARNTSGHAY